VTLLQNIVLEEIIIVSQESMTIVIHHVYSVDAIQNEDSKYFIE